MSYNTWIVLFGSGLLGALAGVVGSFANLRGRALLGDALAHASLPGICLAFWVTGQRQLGPLLAGALVSGLLGVGCVAGLRRWTRVKDDAAIGVVLTSFFACGIALSVVIQHRVASGSKAGLDTFILGQSATMRLADVFGIAGVAVVCLVGLLAFYKEFGLLAFDADFALVQGWPTYLLDCILTTLLSITVVIGLPSVGVAMISALLIVPGATARFWTERLGALLGLSALLGAGFGVGGTLLSSQWERWPTGPSVVLVGACVFTVSVFFGRKGGLLQTWGESRRPLTPPPSLEEEYL